MGAVLGLKTSPGCEHPTGWRVALAPLSQGGGLTVSGPPLSQKADCPAEPRPRPGAEGIEGGRHVEGHSMAPSACPEARSGPKPSSGWEWTHASGPASREVSARGRTGAALAPPQVARSWDFCQLSSRIRGQSLLSQASPPSSPCGRGIASPTNHLTISPSRSRAGILGFLSDSSEAKRQVACPYVSDMGEEGKKVARRKCRASVQVVIC